MSNCPSMRHLEKLAGGRWGLALPLPDFRFPNSGASRSEKKNKPATSPKNGLDGRENHAKKSSWSQKRGSQWKCVIGCSPACMTASTGCAADPPLTETVKQCHIGGWLDMKAGFETQSPDPDFLQVLALRPASLEINLFRARLCHLLIWKLVPT